MEENKSIAIVRENKLNKQKTITVPKKIKNILEYDKIEFREDKEGEVKIKKI